VKYVAFTIRELCTLKLFFVAVLLLLHFTVKFLLFVFDTLRRSRKKWLSVCFSHRCNSKTIARIFYLLNWTSMHYCIVLSVSRERKSASWSWAATWLKCGGNAFCCLIKALWAKKRYNKNSSKLLLHLSLNFICVLNYAGYFTVPVNLFLPPNWIFKLIVFLAEMFSLKFPEYFLTNFLKN